MARADTRSTKPHPAASIRSSFRSRRSCLEAKNRRESSAGWCPPAPGRLHAPRLGNASPKSRPERLASPQGMRDTGWNPCATLLLPHREQQLVDHPAPISASVGGTFAKDGSSATIPFVFARRPVIPIIAHDGQTALNPHRSTPYIVSYLARISVPFPSG